MVLLLWAFFTAIMPIPISTHSGFMSYRMYHQHIQQQTGGLSPSDLEKYVFSILNENLEKVGQNKKDLVALQDAFYSYNHLRELHNLKKAPSFYEIDLIWVREQTSLLSSKAQKGIKEETTSSDPVTAYIVPITAALAVVGLTICCGLKQAFFRKKSG